MIQKFQNHLATNFSFLKNKDLLLATSAGIDSMVMVHLFKKLGYNFGMLHCNFKLRGSESDADMKFVMDYGDKHKIPWSVGHFETKAYAKEMNVSIQVAARELRYDWFEEQLLEKNFDYVLTAHHADDNLETFIINLSRGTGLDGLVGIPSQNEDVIRPLLVFSRQEIEDYAEANNIKWREDSSNVSDKYLRNKIRHYIIPSLKELNTNLLQSFKKTQNHLHEAQTLVDDAVSMMYQIVVIEIGNEIHFDIEKLKRLSNYKAYMYQFLKDYEFSAWNDIYDLLDAQTGKVIFSDDFQISKNRNFLILSPKGSTQREVFYIEKNQKEISDPIKISFQKVNEISSATKSTIFVDQDKLLFPLVLRRWEKGDSFMPFGMNGKSKKLSKFFKDEKMSIQEKENTWILLAQDTVVWIVGLRQDERFRIEDTTKNIMQITLK
jgi:tRNA(Ile)-lysidine synthetase-like protein